MTGRVIVSDEFSLQEILSVVTKETPAVIPVRGNYSYMVSDYDEYMKDYRTLKLLTELAKGDKAISEGRFYSSEDIERMLDL